MWNYKQDEIKQLLIKRKTQYSNILKQSPNAFSLLVKAIYNVTHGQIDCINKLCTNTFNCKCENKANYQYVSKMWTNKSRQTWRWCDFAIFVSRYIIRIFVKRLVSYIKTVWVKKKLQNWLILTYQSKSKDRFIVLERNRCIEYFSEPWKRIFQSDLLNHVKQVLTWQQVITKHE